MIYNKNGETVIAEGKELAVGDRIIATDSDFAGLKGYITEIRTGADKDTENETDDVYCSFDIPKRRRDIKLLERHFSDLFNEQKTIDEIPMDLVIMAPGEIRRLAVNE